MGGAWCGSTIDITADCQGAQGHCGCANHCSGRALQHRRTAYELARSVVVSGQGPNVMLEGSAQSSAMFVDQRDIARRYVQGWLVLDLLAAVPLDTLLRPAIGYASYVVLVALRGLRLLQLMRLNRARVGPFEIGPVPLSIVKTVLIVVLAAHLLSCLWFYVACYDSAYAGRSTLLTNLNFTCCLTRTLPDDTPSSVYVVGGPEDWLRCGHNGSQFSHYLASYYFITYTMTTVGYGDIHAEGKKEMVVAAAIELTGATSFGLIIAATHRIVQLMGPAERAGSRNAREIGEYIRDRGLHGSVAARLRQHFRYHYFKTGVFNGAAVLADLPPELAARVHTEAHAAALKGLALLSAPAVNTEVLALFARLLKPMETFPQDIIAAQGSPAAEVYFVVRGRVEAYQQAPPAAGDALPQRRRSMMTVLSQAKGDLGPFVGAWEGGSCFGLSEVALAQYEDLATYIEAQSATAASAMRACLASPVIASGAPCVTRLRSRVVIDGADAPAERVLAGTSVENLCVLATLHASTSAAAGTDTLAGVIAAVDIRQEMLDINQGVTNEIKGLAGAARSAVAFVAATLGVRRSAQVHTQETTSPRAHSGDTAAALLVRGIVLPGDVRKLRWDLLLLAAAAVEALLIPFEVAFLTGDSPVLTTAEALSTALRILFGADFLLTLRTAFEAADGGASGAAAVVLVSTPRLIARRYARTWMLVDAVSVFPPSLLAADAAARRAVRTLQLTRVLHLVNTGRALRQGMRAGTIANKLSAIAYFHNYCLPRAPWWCYRDLHRELHRHSSQRQVFAEARAAGRDQNATQARAVRWLQTLLQRCPAWATELLKVFSVVFYCAHFFGCVWWLAGQADASTRSWWRLQGLTQSSADTGRAYLASVYFAMTTITTVGVYFAMNTITTVGYGDIVPTSDLQRIVACVIMSCGTTIFSFVIGAISDLARGAASAAAMADGYMDEVGVVGHIRHSVLAHLNFLAERQSTCDEASILARTPARLRAQIVLHIHADTLASLPIYGRDETFMAAVLQVLKPQLFAAGDLVYDTEGQAEGIYFVTSGVSQVSVHYEVQEGRSLLVPVAVVPPGKMFGYTGRLLGAKGGSKTTARALTELQDCNQAAQHELRHHSNVNFKYNIASHARQVYLLPDEKLIAMARLQPGIAQELQACLEEAVFDHPQRVFTPNCEFNTNLLSTGVAQACLEEAVFDHAQREMRDAVRTKQRGAARKKCDALCDLQRRGGRYMARTKARGNFNAVLQLRSMGASCTLRVWRVQNEMHGMVRSKQGGADELHIMKPARRNLTLIAQLCERTEPKGSVGAGGLNRLCSDALATRVGCRDLRARTCLIFSSARHDMYVRKKVQALMSASLQQTPSSDQLLVPAADPLTVGGIGGTVCASVYTCDNVRRAYARGTICTAERPYYVRFEAPAVSALRGQHRHMVTARKRALSGASAPRKRALRHYRPQRCVTSLGDCPRTARNAGVMMRCSSIILPDDTAAHTNFYFKHVPHFSLDAYP
ncbi:hypothetical protein JKP88DRAFT_244353 [Tribonema minus]|uniref:Cyclic nucleotide-binding domain-containing protein n=1 Tax=Tribonema minus TaxID=303371 RepID=A0A836CHH0_9STRA|nr:hypothetical protein JKP88DRAFT_244353 [Tribonema minus]